MATENPEPHMPPLRPFDAEPAKARDAFLLFTPGATGEDPEDDEVTRVDDVIVDGTVDWPGGEPTGPGGWHGEQDHDFVDDGGGDLQDPPIVRPAGWDECQDRAADELAAVAALALSLLPDIDSREYGYIIYRDANGDLQLSTLITGDNHSLTGLNERSQPADLGFTSWSQVVGIIHSHPSIRFGSDGLPINVAPADGHHLPNQDDWRWPDFLVGQQADGVNLRQYIYHAGGLHEYDMYNNLSGNRQTPAENAGGSCGVT